MIKDDLKSPQWILEAWGQVFEQDRMAWQVICARVGGTATRDTRGGKVAGGPEEEQGEGSATYLKPRGHRFGPIKSLLSSEGLAPFPFQSSDVQRFSKLFGYVFSFWKSLTCSFYLECGIDSLWCWKFSHMSTSDLQEQQREISASLELHVYYRSGEKLC